MPKYTPDTSLRELQWKEPDGPWYVRKRIKDPTKPSGWAWRDKSTKLRNKKLARVRALEILADWNVSVPGVLKLELFRDASAAYEASRQNAEAATRASIKNSRKHLDPFFGPMHLDAITEIHFEKFVSARRAKDPNVALYNDWKTFVGTMNLMHAQGHRRLKLRVENPDRDREVRKATFSEEQLDRLFAHADPTHRLQMAMAHDLFMPRKDILGLPWAHIDFKVRTNRDGQKVYGSIYIPKSHSKKRKSRYIPMTEEIYNELVARKKFQDKRWTYRFGTTSPYVFPARGNPQKPVRTIRAFRAIKRRAGLQNHPGTFYSLRHTGLTTAYRACKVEAGDSKEIPASAVKIALVAGHSIQTAMDEYLDLKPADLVGVIALTGSAGGKHLGKRKTYVGKNGEIENNA